MSVNAKWAVDVIESERGWGQKVDETKLFPSFEEAVAFVKTTNAKNNLPVVPDIYWRAEEPYLVEVDETGRVKRR